MENAEKQDETSTTDMALPNVTKFNIRREVWEHLEKNNLVNFPRPVYGRIPNFKGCEEAAGKITELEVYKNAQNIKVNPDKPQEPVRFSVLENHKNLYVPVPRLKAGLLKHIRLPDNPIKDDIRKCVSRRGIDEAGTDIGLDDATKIDLVVLGSVAVSRQGYRIGKGKGYADLEYAILTHMKAVSAETVVVTTVHDSQIIDNMPSEIFGPHDVPVDIIVTPTQVIHIEKRLPKPKGIIWELISQRRLELMPVLKALLEKDKQDGKEIILKDVDSDVEVFQKRRPFKHIRRYRYNNRRPRNDARSRADSDVEKPDDIDNAGGSVPKPQRKKRIMRKRNPPMMNKDGVENTLESKENTNPNMENGSPKRRQKRQVRKNRPMIDFSLVIRNIEKTVRVRDLKAALSERGIKPNIITWRGYKGFCCLHFSKTNPNTISDPVDQSHGVDSVLHSLSDLKISPDSKKQLVVEIMKPISRIETTDVTAV